MFSRNIFNVFVDLARRFCLNDRKRPLARSTARGALHRIIVDTLTSSTKRSARPGHWWYHTKKKKPRKITSEGQRALVLINPEERGACHGWYVRPQPCPRRLPTACCCPESCCAPNVNISACTSAAIASDVSLLSPMLLMLLSLLLVLLLEPALCVELL